MSDVSYQGWEIPLQNVSFEAKVDLSAKQYYAIKQSGDDGITAITNASDYPFGVLQDKPVLNQAGNVMLTGITKMVAGSSTSIGPLGIDATGRAITWTGGITPTIGRGLEAATTAGDIIAVKLGQVT